MRRTHVSVAGILALAMVLAPTAALAQAPAAGPRPTPPYPGTVTAPEGVNVRCGPGLYYYLLLSLPQGTSVTVRGEVRDWLAIDPPAGVCGLVRRSEIALDADGMSGTVSVPGARVYASGPAANRRWCVIANLQEGSKVKPLGPPQDDMLRIEPPENTQVYVSSQYIKPVGQAVGLTPGAIDVTTVDIDLARLKLDPFMESLKEADAALAAEMEKPIAERDYEPLVPKFAEVAEKAEKPYVKQAARQRAEHLAFLIEQKKNYEETMALGPALEARLRELQAQQAAAEAARQAEKATPGPAFQAVGVVARLESLEGTAHPIKHKLLDREGRIVVVLQSDTYTLDDYVGKAVGVRGRKSYLKEWKIYVVAVDDLQVLE